MPKVKTYRLTQTMREDILRQSMRDIFAERVDALVKRSNEFAERIYKDLYSSDVEAITKLKLANNWFHENRASLSFASAAESAAEVRLDGGHKWRPLKTCSGDYVARTLNRSATFQMTKARPVPNTSKRPVPNTSNLVKLTRVRDQKTLQKIEDTAAALREENAKLKEELIRFLSACKTNQDVISNWPEGEKYLEAPRPKHLPIPLVDNVRAAMPS